MIPNVGMRARMSIVPSQGLFGVWVRGALNRVHVLQERIFSAGGFEATIEHRLASTSLSAVNAIFGISTKLYRSSVAQITDSPVLGTTTELYHTTITVLTEASDPAA